MPFLCNSVHNHRSAVVLSGTQGGLNSFLIVPINWAHIFHAEIFKNTLGDHNVLNTDLHAVQPPVNHLPQRAATLQTTAHSIKRPIISMVKTHTVNLLLHLVLKCRQLVSKTANSRRIRSTIVIDYNNDFTTTVSGDIIHGFPGHASGQRTITD